MDNHDDGLTPEPTTARGSLRARRDAARAEKVISFAVPGYDPQIGLRLKPVDGQRIAQMQKQVEKAKTKDAGVVANATFIAEATTGIFEVIDGEQVSIDPEDRHGAWLTFSDERMAELLEEPPGRASSLVRALFVDDLEIASMADKVLEWSMGQIDQIEADYSGN